MERLMEFSSSKNKVPPCASSKKPGRFSLPVKLPFYPFDFLQVFLREGVCQVLSHDFTPVTDRVIHQAVQDIRQEVHHSERDVRKHFEYGPEQMINHKISGYPGIDSDSGMQN